MTGESLYPRDLIERLRGALDEHARYALADGESAIVLRTIQAHRKILDRHAPRPLMNNDGVRVVEMQCSACVAVDEIDWFNDEIAYETYPCADVRDLASIYFPESDGESP